MNAARTFQTVLLAALVAACGSEQPGTAQAEHAASGVVESFDPTDRTLTIAHDAIPSARMAASTTDFAVRDQGEIDTLTRRQAVEFSFTVANGRPVITEIRPAERRTAAAR